MTAPSALLGDIRPTRADRSIPIKNPARRLFPAFRLPDTAPSFLAALAGAFVGALLGRRVMAGTVAAVRWGWL